MLEGGCQCGAVRYQVVGEPFFMVYCHCVQCRRANGTSLATSINIRTRDFVVSQGADALRAYESSPGNHRHFCSVCGSPIYGEMAAYPELRSIRAGTLDDDPGLRSIGHIHVSSKAPWFEIRDDLPQYKEGLVRPK